MSSRESSHSKAATIEPILFMSNNRKCVCEREIKAAGVAGQGGSERELITYCI